MKKSLLIVVGVLVMFGFSILAFGQDCGKCPSKSSCDDPKALKVKDAEKDPEVYVKKDNKFYHTKECAVVKDGKDVKVVKLSEALKDKLNPCTSCKPVTPPPPPPAQTENKK